MVLRRHLPPSHLSVSLLGRPMWLLCPPRPNPPRIRRCPVAGCAAAPACLCSLPARLALISLCGGVLLAPPCPVPPSQSYACACRRRPYLLPVLWDYYFHLYRCLVARRAIPHPSKFNGVAPRFEHLLDFGVLPVIRPDGPPSPSYGRRLAFCPLPKHLYVTRLLLLVSLACAVGCLAVRTISGLGLVYHQHPPVQPSSAHSPLSWLSSCHPSFPSPLWCYHP